MQANNPEKLLIIIDIREASGEKTGKGWYTTHIVTQMIRHNTDAQFLLLTNQHTEAFEGSPNAHQKIIKGSGFLWHVKAAHIIRTHAKATKNTIFFAPTSFIIPAILSKKIKIVMTVHDMVAFLFPHHHNKKAVILERLFMPVAVRKAAAIITVSASTKRDLTRFFPAAHTKAHVIYNAADNAQEITPEQQTAARKRYHLPSRFILDIGTLEPRKNHIRVLYAFTDIAAQFPDHHLVIAGAKGWQYKAVFDAYEKISAQNPDLKKRIHFLGYVSGEDLQTLYTLADVFIFPALYEGFGLPALEALQHGCPVIAPNNSSLPEVVGDAAVLINPYNQAEITEGLRRLLADEKLAQECRVKGLLQARKFSWKKAGSETFGVLTNLILS